MNVLVGTHLFFSYRTDAFLFKVSQKDIVLELFSFELWTFSKHINRREFLGISVSIIGLIN